MQRIAPMDSAGLSRFDASIAPPRGRAGADHGVDLVDEQDRVGQLLELGDDRLQPLLEIAAIARAGEQRAHVERVDHRRLQHLGHVALDDLAREAFGDRGLADAGIADVERVVLRPAAEDLHRPVDLGHAADQRIDLAGAAFSLRLTVNCLSATFLLAALPSRSFPRCPRARAASAGVSPLPTPWLM